MTSSEQDATREVTLTLCERCIAGEGGECHTPGCALWMNRAPDVPIRLDDPSESLTLDLDARTRAADALSDAIEQGYRNHYCDEWDEGDGCTICWDHAADVIRAAEGLRECSRCGGTGDIGGGAAVCCPECGGNGLQAREAAPIHTTETEDR